MAKGLLRWDSWELPALGADHFLPEEFGDAFDRSRTPALPEAQVQVLRRTSSINQHGACCEQEEEPGLPALPSAASPFARSSLPQQPAALPSVFSAPSPWPHGCGGAASTQPNYHPQTQGQTPPPLPPPTAPQHPLTGLVGLGPLMCSLLQHQAGSAPAPSWCLATPAPYWRACAAPGPCEPTSSTERSDSHGSRLTEPHLPSVQQIFRSGEPTMMLSPSTGLVSASTEQSGEEDEEDDGLSSLVAMGSGGVKRKRCSDGSKKGCGSKRNTGRVVCRNCGAQQTPQWRCGPEGPRTLCNACGVRFKKGLPLQYWEAKKKARV